MDVSYTSDVACPSPHQFYDSMSVSLLRFSSFQVSFLRETSSIAFTIFGISSVKKERERDICLQRGGNRRVYARAQALAPRGVKARVGASTESGDKSLRSCPNPRSEKT
ncbi:hypothetical protein EVAR_100320_1 [Eumeta japonica]|uniref:Uncharacterized protein n=1 Tax=Eumeta variegata TaxID=151549 RepID=A0A4C1ZPJ6_EUMVA|nr:hypothetical protein EVAR_100320_1 [Eumeta japonica]